MPTHGEALTGAFESRDLERLIELLDERVIWRGIIDPDRINDDVDHDDGPPMCVDREEVRGIFERFVASGRTGYPLVLAEVGDTVVVDPRQEPPGPFPLHQAFTFRHDRVVLIQDYPDRASALADVGLREIL